MLAGFGAARRDGEQRPQRLARRAAFARVVIRLGDAQGYELASVGIGRRGECDKALRGVGVSLGAVKRSARARPRSKVSG